eukprot:TRINITY_DN91635_c0_g1_i1.p1 TRINITY_DN91635_c0_g1~~TRINITY_DN91635_c0_g1_i1.p1  ORF type:complete len:545 (-),score=76.67 TRINITY_DN91635_c0_g1_i1:65-1699(-)
MDNWQCECGYIYRYHVLQCSSCGKPKPNSQAAYSAYERSDKGKGKNGNGKHGGGKGSSYHQRKKSRSKSRGEEKHNSTGAAGGQNGHDGWNQQTWQQQPQSWQSGGWKTGWGSQSGYSSWDQRGEKQMAQYYGGSKRQGQGAAAGGYNATQDPAQKHTVTLPYYFSAFDEVKIAELAQPNKSLDQQLMSEIRHKKGFLKTISYLDPTHDVLYRECAELISRRAQLRQPSEQKAYYEKVMAQFQTTLGFLQKHAHYVQHLQEVTQHEINLIRAAVESMTPAAAVVSQQQGEIAQRLATLATQHNCPQLAYIASTMSNQPFVMQTNGAQETSYEGMDTEMHQQNFMQTDMVLPGPARRNGGAQYVVSHPDAFDGRHPTTRPGTATQGELRRAAAPIDGLGGAGRMSHDEVNGLGRAQDGALPSDASTPRRQMGDHDVVAATPPAKTQNYFIGTPPRHEKQGFGRGTRTPKRDSPYAQNSRSSNGSSVRRASVPFGKSRRFPLVPYGEEGELISSDEERPAAAAARKGRSRSPTARGVRGEQASQGN